MPWLSVDEAIVGVDSIVELCSLSETVDRWYKTKMEDVNKDLNKYKDWMIDNGLLYRYQRDKLLDEITNGEEGLKLVVPSDRRERVLHNAHWVSGWGEKLRQGGPRVLLARYVVRCPDLRTRVPNLSDV